MRAAPKRGVSSTRPWTELALDVLDAPVVIIDAEGRVVSANGAAASLLAVAPNEVTGHDLDLLVAAAGTSIEIVRRPMQEGGHLMGYVARLVSPSNTLRPLDASSAEERNRDRLQQAVVNHLQEAVQPPAPVVPQADLGVHYLSADPSEPTGGDLYDWYLLPDGDLHIVVVDVIGKGISATKDALAVVHTLRVLVLEGSPLETLVETADRLLTAGNPELVATLLIGRYSPSTGRLVLAGGGHPPLLVVSADGEVEEVTAGGIPLGWPGARSFELVERTLERSQTAVFYTDGLIEAGRDILVGLRELKAAAAETATYPTRHLPRVLVERALVGAQRRDDVLALVLRRRAAPSAPRTGQLLGKFEHRFTPSTASIGITRHFFEDWLRHQGMHAREIDDLAVVVSELCTNAVRAASGKVRGVVLRAWPDGEDVVLEVEDDGPGLSNDVPTDAPAPGVSSGRGLYVARALVDTLEILPTDGATGTIVRCRRRYVFTTSHTIAADAEHVPSRPGTTCCDFGVDVRHDGARTRLEIFGDVDVYAKPSLEGAFARSGPGAGRHIVVDLSGVAFIDSAGLGALSACLLSARDTGAVVSLQAPTRQVMKLFELTGLNTIFPLHGTASTSATNAV